MKERPYEAKSPATIEKAAFDEKIRNLDIKIHRLRSDLNLLSHQQQTDHKNEKFMVVSQLEQEKRILIQQRKKRFGYTRRNKISLDVEELFEITITLILLTDWFTPIQQYILGGLSILGILIILIREKLNEKGQE